MSMLKDEFLEKFNRTLPCVSCRFGSICKYKNRMTPVEVPENFRVTITCVEQERLMKTLKEESNEQ